MRPLETGALGAWQPTRWHPSERATRGFRRDQGAYGDEGGVHRKGNVLAIAGEPCSEFKHPLEGDLSTLLVDKLDVEPKVTQRGYASWDRMARVRVRQPRPGYQWLRCGA